MAPREICCVLFICLFGLGSAEYCTESSDCVVEGETCCSVTFVERFVPTVRTTLNVAVANSVAITNANIHVD